MATTAAPTVSNGIWQPLTVGIFEKSKAPSPRAGHSFVFDPESNASYVFGGASHEEGLSNETYQLDHGMSDCTAG